jgi:hypothetical protein
MYQMPENFDIFKIYLRIEIGNITRFVVCVMTLSVSGYMALNFGIISGRVIGKNVEGSGRGLILENIQEYVACTLETLPDSSVRIAGIGILCTEDALRTQSRNSYRVPAGSQKFILDSNLVALKWKPTKRIRATYGC